MSDNESRAAALVAGADNWRSDGFDCGSPLADQFADLNPLAHSFSDVRNQVEALNYQINSGCGRPVGQGLTAALTADFDPRIKNLTELVMARHRALGSEAVEFDPQVSEDGLYQLPEWDRNNPYAANVIRGIVASRPGVAHILRGGYGADDLINAIWDGHNETKCTVNVAADCDVNARPPRGWRRQKIWGLFTTQNGEYLIFHTICGPCYFTFWPMDKAGRSANFRLK